MITHGPIGRLVRGHVLDVNPRSFARALRDLDKNLYVSWNPKKLKGWGCWEIRRLPEQKRAVYQGTHKGVRYYKLGYVEFNSVHHVLDAAFLNYDAIRKLKEMDTWNQKNWTDDFEAKEAAHIAAEQEKANEALKYAIKQNKSAMTDFYEMVRSGIHPAQVLLSTKWVHN